MNTKSINNLNISTLNEVQTIEEKYKNKIEVNQDLNRKIVSFQESRAK